MTEFTTETGFYILVDSERRVIAKAAVSVGTHPIDGRADPSQCYDVESQDDLNAVDIDPHYATE